ncbi:MAG: 3-isopropylmalate dehydratase small subunit [Myxococcota bacterium]
MRSLAGVAAPLLRHNVDTDTIIRSRDISTTAKTGFGSRLFACWRYAADGSQREEFVLNRPRYRSAAFLVAGSNFGCGSSREAAVWALRDHGIRSVVAISFGSIFFKNCLLNHLVPIALGRQPVLEIVEKLEQPSVEPRLSLDVDACVLRTAWGRTHRFSLPECFLEMLRTGSDPIDATLARIEDIDVFDAEDRGRRPWMLASSRD